MVRHVAIFEHANLCLAMRHQAVDRTFEVSPRETRKREEVTQRGLTTQGVQGPMDLLSRPVCFQEIQPASRPSEKSCLLTIACKRRRHISVLLFITDVERQPFRSMGSSP
jgi:hypothetical protein